MKNFKAIMTIIAFLAVGFTMTSCGNEAPKEEKKEMTDEKKEGTDAKEEKGEQQGKEYTSAYICPMHCEGSGSDAAGTCPACGMDYVKNDADDHGHSH